MPGWLEFSQFAEGFGWTEDFAKHDSLAKALGRIEAFEPRAACAGNWSNILKTAGPGFINNGNGLRKGGGSRRGFERNDRRLLQRERSWLLNGNPKRFHHTAHLLLDFFPCRGFRQGGMGFGGWLALPGGFFLEATLLTKLAGALDQPIHKADRRDDEKQDELFHVALGGVR